MLNTIIEKKENNLEPNIYKALTEDLLYKVQKPGQYLGIEWGHLVNGPYGNESNTPQSSLKRWEDTLVRLSLIYPDLYELGMSNFGTKILYKIINSHPDFLCDRTYAPMKDMEELLIKTNTSLWGWESFKPLNKFDLLGFSLSYELSYTNVLKLLELSNLKPLSNERTNLFPLVFAGGPTTFNPEPMADFMDFFIIGDGEEVIIEILELVKEFKEVIKNQSSKISSKDELLLKLAQIPGIYVPKFYEPDSSDNYLPKPIVANPIPSKIVKRVVNLTDLNQPTSGPVPYLASVQDRQTLEIRRGCDRGCRFCQPGYVYLPVRERTPDDLLKLSQESLKKTGYDEYSFLSLSASDYTCLHEAAVKLNTEHAKKGISLSMPSQRADRFDLKLANELNTVRKSGITLAPEAGTERLREVINKGLKEADITRAIENVYDSGFHHVKLYFMIGLPTETYKDLDGIIDLLKWAYDLSRIKNKKPLEITCTISTFVPKSFTPFQWFSQNSTFEFQEKINYLKNKIKEYKLRTVKLNCTSPNIALLEAVLSRGDRRMSKLIYNAYKLGANFDAWDEHFNIDTWHKAAKELNLDLNYEATKERTINSTSPWEVIESGLLKKFLIDEYNKAITVTETVPCTENTCHACGVCFELDVVNEVTVDKSKNNKFVKTIEKKLEVLKPSSLEIPKSLVQENEACSPLATISNNSHDSLLTKSLQKVEIIHTKNSHLRFISHLDVQRLFERALRRADILFAHTEGYNPRPKYQWLMPLPLYYESNYELLHLELAQCIDNHELQIRLNKQLPNELQLKSVKNIDLSQKLNNVENVKVLYKVLTAKPYLWEKYICEAKTEIESFLDQASVILKVLKNNNDRNKKPKNKNNLNVDKLIDIRKGVERIVIVNDSPFELEMVLLGNTRVETLLNYITDRVLQKSKNEKNEEFSWQSLWTIKKETIV